MRIWPIRTANRLNRGDFTGSPPLSSSRQQLSEEEKPIKRISIIKKSIANAILCAWYMRWDSPGASFILICRPLLRKMGGGESACVHSFMLFRIYDAVFHTSKVQRIFQNKACFTKKSFEGCLWACGKGQSVTVTVWQSKNCYPLIWTSRQGVKMQKEVKRG